jgi:hypothetical protein
MMLDAGVLALVRLLACVSVAALTADEVSGR